MLDLATLAEEKLPWTNSNDTDPMWVGNTVYFLSDRDRTVNLYAYDAGTKALTQLTHHNDFDIAAASAGLDAIVYEQAGYVHLLDPKTGQSHQVNIDVVGDFPWARPQMKRVASLIGNATISPTGTRAAFEARGDIFTMAAQDGSYRNLTQSSGAHDRDPAWSPDGRQVAWFSDESGEFQLMIGEQTGASKPRAIAFPTSAYYASPVWSPNAQHMLFRDSDAQLWTLAVSTGRFTKIDGDWYDDPQRGFDAAWSPDSRWVVYSKSQPSHMRAIFLYSMATGKSVQITDALADAISPAFDASGKYLYFLASTNYAQKSGWLDMSSQEHFVRRDAYLVVLSKDEPSPFLPSLSDEAGRELASQDSTPGKPARAAAPGRRTAAPRLDTASTTRIDVDGIQQRVLPLAVPAGDYANLVPGSAGTFFFTETPFPSPPGGAAYKLWQYRLAEKRSRTFVDGIIAYAVSADSKKMLFGTPDNHWSIVGADEPPKAGDGALPVDALETLVDPKAEWAEIFRESWRTQRQFFYDAKMHGNDWQAIYDKYLPLAKAAQHRADLAYLLASVGGELTVGHSYIEGEGDVPDTAHTSVGLLGADFAAENGRYRIQADLQCGELESASPRRRSAFRESR